MRTSRRLTFGSSRACFSAALLVLVCVEGTPASRAGLEQATAAASECQKWQDCRTQALEAEAAGELVRFHDLAWRTMQKRGGQDPDVMLMLARAQALSGRPHDGLVMLRRIVELGVAPTEALTSHAFARTRALAGWHDVEQSIAQAAAASAPAAGAVQPKVALPRGTTPREADPAGEVTPGGIGAGPRVADRSRGTAVQSAGVVVEEALRFSSRNLVPAGVAHDVASGRVLVGNRFGRSVITVSERLKTAVDLVRAESAGFLEIVAIAIDARRGDLWVASAGDHAGAGPGETPAAALHKLQLVSGRPLMTLPIESGDHRARLTALTVTRSGSVFVLDPAAGRLLKLPPGKRELTLVTALDIPEPVAMAIDDAEQRVYVAHRDGLSRVSMAGEALAAVTATHTANLTAVETLNWYKGTLIAIERMPDGSRRLVRWHLNRRGTSIVDVETIDPAIPTAGRASAAAVSGSDVYYLAADTDSSAGENRTIVVRRARLP